MSAQTSVPKPSMTFILLTFGIATAVGVLIAYLGITGQIGAGVP